ncbi:MAG: tRNA adenosine(34) deaminase TadA [candidate division WOR-3 bacterium]
MNHTDDYFMSEALKEAEKAFAEDEVPVGCIMVLDNRIISRGHNQIERLKDATAHAEMIALTSAANHLGNWRLKGVTVYVTIEPCIMCASALVLARVKKIIFGARDKKFGGCGSVFNIANERKLNHRIAVVEGICREKAERLMRDFFKKKRRKRSERWPSG